MTNDFLWRVENACWTAWPSAESKAVAGWVFRSSGGETRRTNSVNASSQARSVNEVLSAAEEHYTERGLPLLFRILSFQPEFEEELAAAGFLPEGETCTLQADLSEEVTLPSSSIESHSNPSPDWIADKMRLSPSGAAQERAYREMLKNLRVPARFARATHDGTGVSLAYGAITDGILVIESVVTDPAHRGKGLARDVVGSLMAWGYACGAEVSCLQVVADNAPGHALYRKLGFGAELYRYQYWRRPLAA